MVDLVGIDVHMSYIHNLKFRTLEPPSGYKRNYILMKFHTSVYLAVLNKNFLKSFGGAVGKFPLDRENGPFFDFVCDPQNLLQYLIPVFLQSFHSSRILKKIH